MTNNIQPLDHWHHQYLLGNPEALPILQGMLRIGIKNKCPRSLKIAASIKKKKPVKRGFKGFTPSQTKSIEGAVKPIYRCLWGVIVCLALVMILAEGGIYVV